VWRPVVEKVMPFSALDTHYLEDFLDANEAMDMFGDRQDLDLRPPPRTDGANALEDPNKRSTVQMSVSQVKSMFGIGGFSG
jgi:hypothetical protein